MKTAKLFRNGDNQAVRLPKEFRFSGSEVWIKKSGNAVVLLPKTASWESLLVARRKFTPDFMSDRQQPKAAEVRDPL